MNVHEQSPLDGKEKWKHPCVLVALLLVGAFGFLAWRGLVSYLDLLEEVREAEKMGQQWQDEMVESVKARHFNGEYQWVAWDVYQYKYEYCADMDIYQEFLARVRSEIEIDATEPRLPHDLKHPDKALFGLFRLGNYRPVGQAKKKEIERLCEDFASAYAAEGADGEVFLYETIGALIKKTVESGEMAEEEGEDILARIKQLGGAGSSAAVD